jgi:hypothetical protein
VYDCLCGSYRLSRDLLRSLRSPDQVAVPARLVRFKPTSCSLEAKRVHRARLEGSLQAFFPAQQRSTMRSRTLRHTHTHNCSEARQLQVGVVSNQAFNPDRENTHRQVTTTKDLQNTRQCNRQKEVTIQLPNGTARETETQKPLPAGQRVGNRAALGVICKRTRQRRGPCPAAAPNTKPDNGLN